MIANSQFSRFIGNSKPNQLKSTISTHNRRGPSINFWLGVTIQGREFFFNYSNFIDCLAHYSTTDWDDVFIDCLTHFPLLIEIDCCLLIIDCLAHYSTTDWDDVFIDCLAHYSTTDWDDVFLLNLNCCRCVYCTMVGVIQHSWSDLYLYIILYFPDNRCKTN